MSLSLKQKIHIFFSIIITFTFGVNISIVYLGTTDTFLTGFIQSVSYGNLFIIGFIVTIGVTLFLTSIFIKNILRPLDNLKKSVQKISEGDFSTRIRIDRNNNFGFLDEVFNIMAEKFQKLYSNMDQQIVDKAGVLSRQVEEIKKSKSAILNLLEDINGDKKRAEDMVIEQTKELRQEKSRLLASINSLSFGFIIADKNDTILLKNPALSKILDLKEEPKSIHDIADSLKSNAKTLEAINPAGSCKECMVLKQNVEIKDVFHGNKFLRLFCAPVFDIDEVNGYVFLIEDVTEAKVMERSRDEFFAVASHELRTPLTAIRGNSEMILDMFSDKMTDPEVKEMLSDINTSSLRLIDIVNDFLEVSRIEQGKVLFNPEDFDMRDLVKKVVKNLKNLASQKNVNLEYPTENGTLPLAHADKSKIEQVLINLVGNALKFTDKGSITISTEMSSNFIKVSIRDTGLGISEQNQVRLFRKFQQAGESMLARDVTQGTGLGLYISHRLMSNMGGTIALEESILGKGSTFVFTVPMML